MTNIDGNMLTENKITTNYDQYFASIGD